MIKRFVSSIEEYLLISLLTFMVLVVFAEVVARKMGLGIHWAQEATLLANAWMVLLGTSYCVKEKAHICVELLTGKLKAKAAKITLLIALASCLVYSAIYFYGSLLYISRLRSFPLYMQDLPILRWIAASCLLFGFALLALRFCIAAYRVIAKEDLSVLHHRSEVDESMDLAKEIRDTNQ